MFYHSAHGAVCDFYSCFCCGGHRVEPVLQYKPDSVHACWYLAQWLADLSHLDEAVETGCPQSPQDDFCPGFAEKRKLKEAGQYLAIALSARFFDSSHSAGYEYFSGVKGTAGVVYEFREPDRLMVAKLEKPFEF